MKFYKYCAFDKYTIENILKSQIYVNTPNTFNDPFELKPKIIFDTSTQKYKHFLREDLRFKNPGITKAEIKRRINKIIIDLQNSTVENTTDYYYDFFNNSFGIFSLTSKKDNLLMWAHYACEHKGLCLEFEIDETTTNSAIKFLDESSIKKTLAFTITKVSYTSKRPFFNLFNFNNNILKITTQKKRFKNTENVGFNFFFKKANIWEYEDEYRLLLFSDDSEVFAFPQPIKYFTQYLTGIILGARTTSQDEETLKLLIKKLEHKPTLYKAMLDGNEYKLNILPLEN